MKQIHFGNHVLPMFRFALMQKAKGNVGVDGDGVWKYDIKSNMVFLAVHKHLIEKAFVRAWK